MFIMVHRTGQYYRYRLVIPDQTQIFSFSSHWQIWWNFIRFNDDVISSPQMQFIKTSDRPQAFRLVGHHRIDESATIIWCARSLAPPCWTDKISFLFFTNFGLDKIVTDTEYNFRILFQKYSAHDVYEGYLVWWRIKCRLAFWTS